MIRSGLSYNRPDDIIFTKSDLTPIIIQGTEWLELTISPPLKLGNDTQSSLYIAVDKLNIAVNNIEFNQICMECLETAPYSTGNKIIYFDSGNFYSATVTGFGLSGVSNRINYYKLQAPSPDDYSSEYNTLHFRFISGLGTPKLLADINSLVCCVAISISNLKDKTCPRPGHPRGVKRIAPIWN
jgi:hypothetical protein